MAATLNPKLTDAGKAAAINAAANGFQLAITHVALGTGKYDSAATGAGMTAMVGRKEFVQIGSGIITGAGGFRLNVKFNPWEGAPNPYDVSEVGFWAGEPGTPNAVLFAIYSHPSNIVVQRNSLLYLAQYALQITDVPPGSITIVVDPDSTAALALLALHEGASDPHPVYVKKSGDISTGPQLGVTPPQHDAGKAFVNGEFLKRSGHTLPSTGSVQIGVATPALTKAAVGGWVDIRDAGAAATLPLAADCSVGAELVVRCFGTSGVVVAQGGDVISSPLLATGSRLQVFQGETVTFTRNGAGVWEVLGVGFRMPAGIVSYFAGASAPPGWIKLNGALLSRDAYSALWQFAQSQGVVNDTEWSGAGFSGRFSAGTTGSNFRIPDMRGVFLRSLDDGRGLDVNRNWGTFQDHANRSHNHTVYDPGHGHGIYDPGHSHGASADAQGQHAHGIPPGPDAGFLFGGFAGFNNNGTVMGVPPYGLGFGTALSMADATGAAGRHSHNISIAGAGTNVSIYGNTTGIQIQADGSEARPRNVALALCIKF